MASKTRLCCSLRCWYYWSSLDMFSFYINLGWQPIKLYLDCYSILSLIVYLKGRKARWIFCCWDFDIQLNYSGISCPCVYSLVFNISQHVVVLLTCVVCSFNLVLYDMPLLSNTDPYQVKCTVNCRLFDLSEIDWYWCILCIHFMQSYKYVYYLCV